MRAARRPSRKRPRKWLTATSPMSTSTKMARRASRTRGRTVTQTPEQPAPHTAHGTHDFVADPRNATILVNVNGQLVAREQAVVSVFDAGFLLGDGVWEGLRVSAGHPAFLEQHLDRLWEG